MSVEIEVPFANAPIQERDVPLSTCLYSSRVSSMIQAAPTLSFQVKDLTEKKWREEQGYRATAPVGTRALLRRRFHETVIQDTMMIRLEHEWACFHVFYTKEEVESLPLTTKIM
jgi:hypothetical protein